MNVRKDESVIHTVIKSTKNLVEIAIRRFISMAENCVNLLKICY
jgi:hypothetical protein